MVVHGQFDVVTLDSFFSGLMSQIEGRVAVLKIDVEGFEDRVRHLRPSHFCYINTCLSTAPW
jgi:hypothetical protein